MANKYEIEKVTFGDGEVRYFVLWGGSPVNTIIGLPCRYDTLQEAREYIEKAVERERRKTVVSREIVE